MVTTCIHPRYTKRRHLLEESRDQDKTRRGGELSWVNTKQEQDKRSISRRRRRRIRITRPDESSKNDDKTEKRRQRKWPAPAVWLRAKQMCKKKSNKREKKIPMVWKLEASLRASCWGSKCQCTYGLAPQQRNTSIVQ